MKLSIFTPTHNNTYLLELWESIQAQTYQNFEWIILANNGVKINIEDPRVKIINFTEKTCSVGLLKKTACSFATGDILVEIDHDDVITPNCLEEVAKVFEDPEIGFAFSDNAKLSDTFVPYNKAYGWEHSKFNWRGKEYYRMHSFEPSALSFSFIWFLPDHIRCWRASVYNEIGGHDPLLEVLDDQSLVLRTYLQTKIHHINKCLYLYRITGENTWLKKSAKIQTETVKIYHKYAYQIAERWSDLNGLKKIDLGGGISKPQGYTSIDLQDGDITADLSKGIPLPDNSVGILRAHDVLEHLPNKQFTMSECWRVLADGGFLMVKVPSTDGRGAFQDPTHCSFYNQNSFWYWTRKEAARYIRNEKIRFQEFRLETIFPSEWHRENNIPYTIAYLAAIKSNKRRPHLIKI